MVDVTLFSLQETDGWDMVYEEELPKDRGRRAGSEFSRGRPRTRHLEPQQGNKLTLNV